MIEHILHIATNPGDLVMDSFAGSGTTAHAALKINTARAKTGLRDSRDEQDSDGGVMALSPVNPANPDNPVQKKTAPAPRRFILVEMKPSIAAGITRERVRRVAKGCWCDQVCRHLRTRILHFRAPRRGDFESRVSFLQLKTRS